jgi:hypothetical protein
MNCPYCNEPADQLDSIVKLPNGDRVHFKCSDKMLGEWAGLKAKLEQTEKALELACDFITEETDVCLWNESINVVNNYGGYDCDLCHRYPIEKCTKDYYLTKAKEALNG